jgi:hypothetical protein
LDGFNHKDKLLGHYVLCKCWIKSPYVRFKSPYVRFKSPYVRFNPLIACK